MSSDPNIVVRFFKNVCKMLPQHCAQYLVETMGQVVLLMTRYM